MFLPALLQHDATGPPGSPAADGHRDQVVAGMQSADTTTRRVHDERRLRRVKDSREQLKSRTRARGASSGTIDTLTSNSTAAGRSYTVANVYGGRLYLRYVGCLYLVILVPSFTMRKEPASVEGACFSGRSD